MELGAIPANNATAPFLAHKQVPVEYTIGKTTTLVLLFDFQLGEQRTSDEMEELLEQIIFAFLDSKQRKNSEMM